MNALWLAGLAPWAALLLLPFAGAARPWLPVAAAGLVGVAAGVTPAGAEVALDMVLLGLHGSLDAQTRMLLAATALIWVAVTVAQVRRRTCEHETDGVRDGLLLTAMGGNVWVLLSDDASGFFLGYALMGLSAAILILRPGYLREGGGPAGLGPARLARTATLYALALTVLGESLLLAGLMRAAADAPDLLLSSLRDHADPQAMGLILLALGIKFAVPGVHFYLPLAYGAAPAPVAAALGGAVMSAGIAALAALSPWGRAGFESLGAALLVLGTLAAFYGVAMGLPQRLPRALLGYSSMSQMGLVLMLSGWMLSRPAVSEVVAANLLLAFAVHHGLVKAALLLLADGPRVRMSRLRWGLAAWLALSLAGLPLTSGWWAKAALKTGLADWPWLWALSLSTLATTLLMVRLLWLLRPQRSSRTASSAPAAVWFLALAGVWVAPVWTASLSGAQPEWAASWPIALGLALAAVAWAMLRDRLPPALRRMPPGDGVSIMLRRLKPSSRLLPNRHAGMTQPCPADAAPASLASDFENELRQWPLAGVGLLLVLTILFVSLLLI